MCDVCEPAEFYNDQRVTARKPHQCSNCFRAIKPGEEYIRITGKWDGDVMTEKLHIACNAFMVKLAGETGECVCFGQVEMELESFERDHPLVKEWEQIRTGAAA